MPNKTNSDENPGIPNLGTNIELAAWYLRQGLPVGMPTETVYGMAANALDAEAVARIFKAKQRPDFDPLIVHLGPNSPLGNWVNEIPKEAEALMAAFWPGPLTLLLPKSERIPGLVTSGLDRVGLRMPRHPMAMALLEQLDFPLAAPSANLFGYISPTSAKHVREAFGPELPYVLDGGDCEIGLESTILGFESGQAVVYRWGGIDLQALSEVLGYIPQARVKAEEHPAAPGMLARHYAPKTPLMLLKENKDWPPATERAGIILPFQEPLPPGHSVWVLSESGDPFEVARRWYAVLREADSAGLTRIYVRMVGPDIPFFQALNDKFLRAAVSN
jgi:L-threonylcarbamoyladenylate synthase